MERSELKATLSFQRQVPKRNGDLRPSLPPVVEQDIRLDRAGSRNFLRTARAICAASVLSIAYAVYH